MDLFTKWTEAFSVRDHQAAKVAKLLLGNVFSQFGMLEELLSDQGRSSKVAVCRSERHQDHDQPIPTFHQQRPEEVPPHLESDAGKNCEHDA